MVGSVLRSIWKMRPDGTDDAQAWPMPVLYLSYAVTANAPTVVAPGSGAAIFLRSVDKTFRWQGL